MTIEEEKNKTQKNSEVIEKQSEGVKKMSTIRNIFSGFTVMIIVNILSIFLTIFFVVNLNSKSLELKKIKNELVNADKISSTDLVESELKLNSVKSDELLALFPDDTGLIAFISQIDKAKVRGVITDFYFANQDAVKDRTGNYGIPFVLSMRGSWDDIDFELQELQKLKYFIRTITFKTKLISDNELKLDFGGFIYVNQSLGKTK